VEKARSGVEAGRLYGGDWGSGGPERGAWKFSFSKPVICRFLPGIIAAAKTHASALGISDPLLLCKNDPPMFSVGPLFAN